MSTSPGVIEEFAPFMHQQLDLLDQTKDYPTRTAILNALFTSLAYYGPNAAEKICNANPRFRRACQSHSQELAALILYKYFKWPTGVPIPFGVDPGDILNIVRRYTTRTGKVNYDAVFSDPNYLLLVTQASPLPSPPPTPPSSPGSSSSSPVEMLQWPLARNKPRHVPSSSSLEFWKNKPPFVWPPPNPIEEEAKAAALAAMGALAIPAGSSSKKSPRSGSSQGRSRKNDARAAMCIKKTENLWNFKRTELKKFPIKDVATRSPKLYALFRKMDELNARDHAKYGHGFKHYIFVNNKQEYGVKVVIAAFNAKPGYHVLNTPNRGLSAAKAGQNNVGFLVSSLYQGINYDTKAFRREIMGRYNERPKNTYGDQMNVIILDSGFKEGIDLLDVKYVHIFDELKNQSEFKQAVGRALRYCGQSGLPYAPGQGWNIEVFTYKLQLPRPIHGATTAGQLYWETMDVDAKKKQRMEDLVEGVLDYVSII